MSKNRKEDHLKLTIESQVAASMLDSRFNYEPILGSHSSLDLTSTFLGKSFKNPLWFSSMTGGAKDAKNINSNMAQIAQKYGLGMGLGSCRSLLKDTTHLKDFQVRALLGDDRPLYANLGMAQIERLVFSGQYSKIVDLIKMLEADGLIIHINPLQEWFQPEGDRFERPPLETLKELINKLDIKLMVKEVGHGFGPKSLQELIKLPLVAIELAGFGGTNFSALEALRAAKSDVFTPCNDLINVGHSTEDMIDSINKIIAAKTPGNCHDIIISGGVKGPLDAYYLRSKLQCPNVIGQAAAILKYAQESVEALDRYVENFLSTYQMAQAFLTIKE
jgi:isopentenyl-diphosphate Delta-isomerase